MDQSPPLYPGSLGLQRLRGRRGVGTTMGGPEGSREALCRLGGNREPAWATPGSAAPCQGGVGGGTRLDRGHGYI